MRNAIFTLILLLAAAAPWWMRAAEYYSVAIRGLPEAKPAFVHLSTLPQASETAFRGTSQPAQ